MGSRTNYKCGALVLYIIDSLVILVCRLYLVNFVNMLSLTACPEKFLRIRPSGLNLRVISVYHKYGTVISGL